MRIAAVGDIHGDTYLKLFDGSLRKLRNPDLFFLVGDTTEKNDIESFGVVIEMLKKKISCPIISIFGDEEWEQDRDKYRTRFDSVLFLDDEKKALKIEDKDLLIVGSTGSLDRPTFWQRKNIHNIWRKYAERVKKIQELLQQSSQLKILVTHYAPTYLTLEGEREKYFPEMGCKKLEKIIKQMDVDLVIHAHSHKGKAFVELKREQSSLQDFKKIGKSVPIYNVSLPLRGEITIIEM